MRISKIVPVVVRVLLGALLVFSGSNKLLHFMAVPLPPGPPTAFIGALAATGYMLTVIGLVEVIFGGLLIIGRFVPLALTVLAPVVVNVALFHLLLAPAVPMVVILLSAEIYLAWVYRDAFRGVLQPTVN